MDWEVSVETLCEKERKPLKLFSGKDMFFFNVAFSV